jgi:hypothetical protein
VIPVRRILGRGLGRAALAGPLAFGVAALSASAQPTPYFAPTLAMSIDSGPFEIVAAWSGGDPRGKPVTGTTPLQVSGFAYAPIVVDVAIGPVARAGLAGNATDRIVPWITDFLATRDGPHTVDLVTADLAGKANPVSIHATGVRLSEVHTPVLDSTSKSPVQLTLVMLPQQTQPFAAGTPIANTLKMTEIITANFGFQISGVSRERTTHVEPIVFSRSSSGTLGISNIIEDEIFASAGDVLAWRDDFVVQGHNGNTYRRLVALDLQSAPGTSVLGLQFTGVGILSAATAPQAASTEAIKTAHVELFAGGVNVATPAGTTTMSTGAPGGATQPISAATKVPPATATATAQTVAGSATTAATSTNANTNPADQGARDPAGVPRLAGLKRTSYTASKEGTRSTEIANYSTDASVDDTAAAYENAIKAAGWDESGRNEQGDTGKRTHLIMLAFRQLKNTLNINVGDNTPTGTAVRVLLVTQP